MKSINFFQLVGVAVVAALLSSCLSTVTPLADNSYEVETYSSVGIVARQGSLDKAEKICHSHNRAVKILESHTSAHYAGHRDSKYINHTRFMCVKYSSNHK